MQSKRYRKTHLLQQVGFFVPGLAVLIFSV